MGFEIQHSQGDLDELFNIDFGDIAQECLNEAAPILVDSVKRSIKSSIAHEGDSELANSFKASKPKKTRNGAYILNVSPKGYSSNKVFKGKNGKRKYPVSNALKAIWKEYGISSAGHHQAASPFLARATNDAEGKVQQLVQKKLNEKLGG